MPAKQKTKAYSHEALYRYAKMLGFGDIHYRLEPNSGLQSIIAVHNTTLGPAIGGCRFYPYTSYGQALKDVLRLASMMTIKNAACGLAHGGAKAVIIKPQGKFDRKKLFQAFGDFVEDINGDYITAMDVGTSNQDMDDIAERTSHVIGSIRTDSIQEDPSPYTATGVLRGIQAAVKFKLNRDSLEGITVAIQGVGKVGASLARQLHELGASIIASDINKASTTQLADEIGAKIVDGNDIVFTDCDVLSPCALGGTITYDTATKIKAKIIAGCANNQLTHHTVNKVLKQIGILYVPDFMVNAGGVIQAASVHDYHDIEIANKKIDQLYNKLYELFKRAAAEDLPPAEVAFQIALEKLQHTKPAIKEVA